MKIDRLQFKWDFRAGKQAAGESQHRNKDHEMMSLEEYIDFIEQFTSSKGETVSDQHVDKKFTLD